MIVDRETVQVKLNTSRKYTNAVSTRAALYFKLRGNHVFVYAVGMSWGYMVVYTAEYVALLFNEISKATHGLVLAWCEDLKIMEWLLKDADVKYTAFKRSEAEIVYIKCENILIMQCEEDSVGKISDIEGMLKHKIAEAERSGTLGLTTAGEVRARIHAAFGMSRWNKERIGNLLFDNAASYKYVMHRAYRGGWVFATAGEYGACDIYDITSAHIYHMLNETYPCKKFEVAKGVKDLKELYRMYISRGFAVLADITFTNLRKIEDHGIENKALTQGIVLIDASRHIEQAQTATVLLTEIDLDMYKYLYMWDRAEVNSVLVARKDKLPAYVRNTLLQLYVDKAEKKAAKEDYTAEKRRLNIVYGACASKINMTEYGTAKDIDTQYQTERYKKELSPLWAVWTVAYTRRQQALMYSRINKKKSLCVYGDTDSVIVDTSNVAETVAIKYYIKSVNDDIITRNVARGLPGELGTWDIKHVKKLRVIGAKQYAYIDADDKTVIKASGIRKKATEDMQFDDFREGAKIRGARRHLERVTEFRYKYVYDDLTLGEAKDLDETAYFMSRLYRKE